MQLKSKIDNNFIKLNDIDDLSNYVNDSISNNIDKDMGAILFTFKLSKDSTIEESMISELHKNLVESGYSVFINLCERIISVKW